VSDDAAEFEQVLRWILSEGASVNFYMFHGGTNFGFMAGAMEPYEPYITEHSPVITSYGLTYTFSVINLRGTTLSAVSQTKVPTFKLSVTLSNLNRFSKVLHCWKAYEICYKTYTTLPTSPLVCCYTTLGN